MPTQPLTQLFQEYLRLSAEQRPNYIASLGAGDEACTTSLAELVPQVPELLEAVYSTVAGTGSDEEDPSLVEFIPGYRLIHREEYAQEMQVLAGVLQEKGQETEGVILPLLTNYGSDFICYHRSVEGVERICDLLHDYGDLVVMYDSPALFLETLCEFYKQEVYFLDEEGYLDCDLVKEGEVAAALNPEANYWSE
ncbi:hypothetical protein GCM10010912_39170 [Paenibacillus albidus]|uniref:SMI1/KNR4 family protein n=1 Tax=Paenibacillus albidus TaxID=2041023 RepID=A0A917CJA3_9BACL|nr:SMI1/KNR4 family protein [Paenibacillus albidus]GGF90163.1 hypothetical protein GCM10010912_39170 [Paenibacillus albidus]